MNKKLVVYLDKECYKIEVDAEIFDDYRLEACTRVIEKLFAANNFNITPFIFCEDLSMRSNSKKRYTTYNAYKLIINAGFHKKAERLRTVFLEQNNLDLANQPIQSSK